MQTIASQFIAGQQLMHMQIYFFFKELFNNTLYIVKAGEKLSSVSIQQGIVDTIILKSINRDFVMDKINHCIWLLYMF